MAKIGEGTFRTYTDGLDRMTAPEYMREREIIRIAINDIDDKVQDAAGDEKIQEVRDELNQELSNTVKTINGIAPVNGNVVIEVGGGGGGGGGGGDISAAPLGQEPVQLEIPVDVRGLFYIPSDTSLQLKWNESISSVTIGYKVYVNGNLFDDTTLNTLTLEGLTKATTYTIKVTAISANGESSGTSIEAKTNGNVGLAMKVNHNRVLLTNVEFDTIEFDCILNPRLESWENVLLSMPGVERLVSSQYAGENDWFTDGANIYPRTVYLDGVETGNQWGEFVVEKNKRVKLAFDIPFTGKRDFIVFANGDMYSTLQGKIFSITLSKMQENGEVSPVAIYNFTYAGTGTVSDLLGNSQDVTIVSGTFE